MKDCFEERDARFACLFFNFDSQFWRSIYFSLSQQLNYFLIKFPILFEVVSPLFVPKKIYQTVWSSKESWGEIQKLIDYTLASSIMIHWIFYFVCTVISTTSANLMSTGPLTHTRFIDPLYSRDSSRPSLSLRTLILIARTTRAFRRTAYSW